MLILNADDVQRAFPMSSAISTMKRAMIALSRGDARIPERIHLDIPAGPNSAQGTLLVMPGFVQPDAMAVKTVGVFNGNREHGLANVLGIVNVLDPETGKPLAVLDGGMVTAIRTAAMSAAATDVLARSNSERLAIIGSGTQALMHYQAIRAVRPIRSVSFYARNQENVRRLTDSICNAPLHEDQPDDLSKIELTVAKTSAEAICDADIICTTTNSKTVVIDDAAVPADAHVNTIGSYKPDVVEIPGETVKRSRVFVDQRKPALTEAGDLVQAIAAGLINPDHIVGEIGDVFLGRVPGRTDDDQLTLFKSVGNTVQDVVACRIIVDHATQHGIGQEVSF